jgi:hypothetical protein
MPDCQSVLLQSRGGGQGKLTVRGVLLLRRALSTAGRPLPPPPCWGRTSRCRRRQPWRWVRTARCMWWGAHPPAPGDQSCGRPRVAFIRPPRHGRGGGRIWRGRSNGLGAAPVGHACGWRGWQQPLLATHVDGAGGGGPLNKPRLWESVRDMGCLGSGG